MPEVSVVIPVYNVEKYLSKCLDSVLAQTYHDFEIVVVEDGATDSCPAICDQYALAHPDKITVLHQQNQGLSNTRNNGLICAQGRYILFVDSDDYIQPDMLEQLYGTAERFGYPDMVFCKARLVSEVGKTTGFHKNDLPPETLINAYDIKRILLTYASSWSRLVKKEIYIENNLFFPKNLWYEDLCMTTKLLVKCDTIVYLDLPLYNYRLREGSIMGTVNPARFNDIIIVFEDIISFYKEQGIYDDFRVELEALANQHALYQSTIRVLRADPHSAALDDIYSFTIRHFPSHMKNPYLAGWKKQKLLYLNLISKRRYRPVVFMLGMQKRLRELKGNK